MKRPVGSPCSPVTPEAAQFERNTAWAAPPTTEGGLGKDRIAVSTTSTTGANQEALTASTLRLVTRTRAGGRSRPFFYRALAGAGQRCATAPESKHPGGPGGWAFLWTTRAEFDMLVHDVDPQVFEAFISLYERDPCGYFDDVAGALTANIARAPTVEIPVLLTSGEHDSIAPPAAVELQRARYELGSDDVGSLIVSGTGHQLMFERRAPVFRAGLSSWLTARGF